MARKTLKIGRLVARLASRYGDEDEDVVRLRMDLAEIEAVEAIHEEHRISTAKRIPLKVTARKLYLKSVSIDAVNRGVSRADSP